MLRKRLSKQMTAINIYQDGAFENILANSQYSSFPPSLYFEKLPTQKVKEEYSERP